MQRRHLLSLPVVALCASRVGARTLPAVWLASAYRANVPLADYWVSEKYDGIRGYWNGQALLTRHGNPLTPPAWFTKDWPPHPVEGELWAGRGRFEFTASVLQQKHASDAAWQQLHFMVFDLPAHAGTFTERLQAYQDSVRALAHPWVRAVAQWQVSHEAALAQQLRAHVNDGAEGLVLHRAQALYKAGRSQDVLKLKPQDDAQAQVVGYVPGRGKHAQRTGALWVQTPEGLKFKLGTGLSDAQRQQPPALGEWVTYSYRGLTSQGLPRFASFVRIHPAIER